MTTENISDFYITLENKMIISYECTRRIKNKKMFINVICIKYFFQVKLYHKIAEKEIWK